MIKTDQFAISANGKQLMRVNDNIAVDINTGNPHFTQEWSKPEDEEK